MSRDQDWTRERELASREHRCAETVIELERAAAELERSTKALRAVTLARIAAALGARGGRA